MVDVDDILKTAIEKDASDVHLISGIRPMLRIARHLTPYEGCDNLTPEDMADIYDYFIRGNIDKDAVFTQTKKLDSSFEFNGLRFRVNISLSGDVPVFTLRLIKNELPTFDELGVPDTLKAEGEIEPNTKLFIEEFGREALNEIGRASCRERV